MSHDKLLDIIIIGNQSQFKINNKQTKIYLKYNFIPDSTMDQKTELFNLMIMQTIGITNDIIRFMKCWCQNIFHEGYLITKVIWLKQKNVWNLIVSSKVDDVFSRFVQLCYRGSKFSTVSRIGCVELYVVSIGRHSWRKGRFFDDSISLFVIQSFSD